MLAKKYLNKDNIYATSHKKCYSVLTIVWMISGNGSKMSGVIKINNKRHQRLINILLWGMTVIVELTRIVFFVYVFLFLSTVELEK